MRNERTSFVFPFFIFSSFSLFPLSCFFAVVVGLLPGLLSVQNFRENVNETGNSYMYIGIAMGRRGKFSSEFFTQVYEHFMYIFQAQFNQTHCSGYYWKELFILQNLSTSDALRRSRQEWNKGPRFSWAVCGVSIFFMFLSLRWMDYPNL